MDILRTAALAVADALVNFGVLAFTLTLLGLLFGVLLTLVPAGTAGLIARKGVTGADRIYERAIRIRTASTARPKRFAAEMRSLAAVPLLVGSITIPASTAVLALWERVEVGTDLRAYNFATVTTSLVMVLLALYAAHLIGPTGMVFAFKLARGPRVRSHGWPAPILRVHGGNSLVTRHNHAVELHVLYLCGNLVRAALLASGLLAAIPSSRAWWRATEPERSRTRRRFCCCSCSIR